MLRADAEVAARAESAEGAGECAERADVAEGASGRARAKADIDLRDRGPLAAQTDLELLEGLRAGSEPHFSELYSRYFQRIYSFVYTRMRNHADAEEVVQETFTAVFRSFETYRGTSSLLSWIYGIAKNTLNGSLRRAKTEGERLNALSQEAVWSPSAIADCNPEEYLTMRRYTETIKARLESISEWQSEVFVMRHLQNMSIQEISTRTHRSSDAIRSSLYRVKRLLFETAELSGSGSPNPPPTQNSQRD